MDWTPDRETVITLLVGGEIFLSSKVSRPSFEAHTDPIQWLPRLIPRRQYNSLGVSLSTHFHLLKRRRKSGAAFHSPICLHGAHTVSPLHRSLNAIMAQLKNRPFGVNTTLELKNITTRSDITGTLVN